MATANPMALGQTRPIPKHGRPRDMRDRRRAALAHDEAGLRAEDIEDALHP